MSLILYQFPFSHFCEKARWALDYKGLDYVKKDLLPGAHVKVTMRLASRSSVPVLQHNDKCVQGSAQIISYLDEQFPDKKLTPVNPQEYQTAMEWERYLDQEVGIHVRRYMYHSVLRHRGLATGFFAANQPFYTKVILWFAFSKLKKRMRKFMDINAETAEQSKQHVQKALTRLNDALQGKKFLVGDRFSRADLSACALLAFLVMPKKFGVKWPQQWPEPLAADIAAMASQLQWVNDIYDKYR